MKRMTLAVIITVAPIAVQAGPYKTEDIDGMCELIYDMTHQLMLERQQGVGMKDMMASAKSSDKWVRDLVVDAYEVPRFRTTKNQQKMALKFANESMTKCYRHYQ